MENDPNQIIAEVFYRLNIGAPIQASLLEKTFSLILTNPQVKARDAQLGSFLSGLMVRGLNASDIAVLIKTALNIDGLLRFKPSIPPGEKLIGVAGSGKKGCKTFNISTLACLVASSLGVYVSKPGSSATSSVSGSKDFALAVGAKMLPNESMSKVLSQTGFGLFSIETMIPKFDGVYGGKNFGPTPLSYGLPSIINPIVCDTYLYGLSHPNVELSLEVFEQFGYKNVAVVASTPDKIHYVDELTTLGNNLMGRIIDGENQGVKEISYQEISSEKYCSAYELKPADSLLENVQLALKILQGKGSIPQRDTVAMNAAAIMMLAEKCKTFSEGFEVCLESLKEGKGLIKLKDFVEATGGSTKSIEMMLGGNYASDSS